MVVVVVVLLLLLLLVVLLVLLLLLRLLLVLLLAPAPTPAAPADPPPPCSQLALKLLREGANARARSEVGETPLHLAGICMRGCPRDASLVSALLAAGADPDAAATGAKSLRMRPLHWYIYGSLLWVP